MFWLRYIGVFSLGFFVFITLMSMSRSPEYLILGTWNEMTWEYEKVDKNDTLSDDYIDISNYVKNRVGQDLVIHSAEKWRFYSNGTLALEGENEIKLVSWKMKGRGNILEIKYDEDFKEYYSLTKLSDDLLILNFETDTHTRGIARLTFEKTL